MPLTDSFPCSGEGFLSMGESLFGLGDFFLSLDDDSSFLLVHPAESSMRDALALGDFVVVVTSSCWLLRSLETDLFFVGDIDLLSPGDKDRSRLFSLDLEGVLPFLSLEFDAFRLVLDGDLDSRSLESFLEIN